ncbi:MAG: type I-F CRISPR-associated endoribonuclease Cas6/Csy4 [Sulfurimonas sp.]|nr:type I-F CRISPR-associated endoribonuclease Cas6/Csy4 [Sulfurimonas sp.]
MNYYVDIKLLSDTEITLGFIWQKVYSQMHLALVEIKDENNTVDVGFSFPLYGEHPFPLGDTLRVLTGSKERLEALDVSKWLNRLDGYAYVGEIKEVPSDIKGYVSFGRKQFKSNTEIRRLAKRYAKRNGISEEEALSNYELTEQKYTKLKDDNQLAFVNMKSLSNGHPMKIFIVKKEVEKEEKGAFSTYGLSNFSTLPCF